MKFFKSKAEIITAIGLGLGAVTAAGIYTYFSIKSKKEAVENKEYIKLYLENNNLPDDIEHSDDLKTESGHVDKTVYSFDEAYEIALETAKKQFGENGFVVPASEKKALYVNISGEKRACYMFGADKMDFVDGSMKGLYHVDADTGEVFDNSGGDMKQIRFI